METNMIFSDSIQKAIRRQDVDLAQVALFTCLDADERHQHLQTLKVADEVAEKFLDFGKCLFEKEDNVLVVRSETEWSRSYYMEIRGALQTNFSREKLELAEKVILYLRNQGNPSFQVIKETTDHHPLSKTEPGDATAPETGTLEKRQAKNSRQSRSHGNEKSSSNARLAQDNHHLSAIRLGAAIGGGTGLVAGLIAGITLKATICGGILAGGIAGAIVSSRTKNDR